MEKFIDFNFCKDKNLSQRTTDNGQQIFLNFAKILIDLLTH